MTLASDIVDELKTNSSITTLLTGGIYDADDLGRQGLTFSDVKAIWNGTRVKPCCFVRTRQMYPTMALRDEQSQTMSYRQAVEFILYQDGGYAIIDSVRILIFQQLHDRQVSSNRLQYAGLRDTRRAEELSDASEIVVDFIANGLMEGS